MNRRFLIAVIVAALTVLAPVMHATTAAAAWPKFNPPKSYYLALGDSLTFGYQEFKVQAQVAATGNVYTVAPFNTGYVDDFAKVLAPLSPGIQTVNYGCPGETSTSFRTPGGCYWQTVQGRPLHNAFPVTGSQLDAALTFLGQHPGQVSPITLDLGANDLLAILAECNNDVTNQSCLLPKLHDALSTFTGNLSSSLTSLRAAAPYSEIIVMENFDPIGAPLTLYGVSQLNQIIVQAAGASGARVADAFTPFNVAPPPGQTLCTLTLFCTQGDIHASDTGYQVIADQFWAASGYSRLSD